PKGTQNRVKPPRRQKALPASASKRTDTELAAVREELKLLPELVKKTYLKWTNGATKCQLECMGAQVIGQDTVLHAATGAGKTGIAAGPHLLPSSKGKVTLLVSPLLSLHEEQVETFKNEFGLKAVAINSAHGGCTKEITESVVTGEHQIVIISPEMLLTRRFIDGVLRKPEFGRRCLSVFIDEAHCVSHWGDSFRKKYGSIGIIRAFLPRAVPIIAVSATLTPRVHRDILTKLRIDPKNYLYVNIGNDRPAVSHVVRAMEHPMNSFRDLDFLVPDFIVSPEDLPKTFLYCDDTKDGADIIDHLNARVHQDYRARGLVRPYNASMSREYRDTVMCLFRAGIVRILVCTDAAGMASPATSLSIFPFSRVLQGCDLPDVDIVVQWKAPTNMSSWIQRAGRAARGHGREGLAVMLVEKTAFEVNTTGSEEASDTNAGTMPTRARGTAAPRGGRGAGRGRGGRGGHGRGRGRGRGKDYAILHGQKRGSFSGKADSISRQVEPEIADDSPGEGLYVYIQSTTCRRAIQAAIFRNDTPNVDPLKCCDLCNPRLFDRTRPSKPLAASRQQAAKKGVPMDSVRQALYGWRRTVKKEKYPRAIFSPQAILDDDTCELLCAIGPIRSIDQLSQHLGGWARWDTLGQSLFTFMESLPIPELVPATRKRPSASVDEDTPAPKRARVDLPPDVAPETPSTAPSNPHPRPSLPPPPPAKRARTQPAVSQQHNPSPSTPWHQPSAILGPSRVAPTPPHPYTYPTSPFLWQPGHAPYSFNPYAQYYPMTPQTPSLSGPLSGNPYAALVTPSPFARGPSNSSSQPRGPAPTGSNSSPEDTAPSP
ncbi:P-loop containing nucleoside triphosphate hydrolase protein, partial [Mycena galericulata]